MIRRWIQRCQYRFNSGAVRVGEDLVQLEDVARRRVTTPYSDKYYQPIIRQGFQGFDRLILPKDFYAGNQEIDIEDESSHLQQKELEEIVKSFDADVKVSIGYGSGVFPQIGYENDVEQTQIDFINIVDNVDKFHKANLFQHPQHYSVRIPLLIRIIQGKNGIYFNPFIRIRKKLIKYGIILTRASLVDLSEWSSLYFAGRMQKPVNFIKDDEPMVKFLNQYNLKNAMTLLILLIESAEFSERELYEQITRISYLGDFRMYIGGENPNKVRNIVEKQFPRFKKLYDPILHYFIQRNCLVIVSNNNNDKTFRKNLTISNKIKLISTLPLQFRSKLYRMYQEKSIKEIVNDKNLSRNLTTIVSRTIQISSIMQTVRGIFSAGIFKSIKYAFAKQLKFWKGKRYST